MKRMETRTEQLHSNSQKRFFAEQTAVHDSLAFRRLYEALSCELAAERMRERERTENVEIVMRVYDTSRPADTLTGKPPLMCETTERRIAADSEKETNRFRQEEAHTAGETAGAMVRNDTVLRVRADSIREGSLAATTEIKTRRGLAWWQYVLCVVGLLTMAYGPHRIFKKRETHISQ